VIVKLINPGSAASPTGLTMEVTSSRALNELIALGTIWSQFTGVPFKVTSPFFGR